MVEAVRGVLDTRLAIETDPGVREELERAT